MTHRFLELTFRRGKLVAGYLHLDRKPDDRSVRTKELAPGTVADYADDGRAIGVEFIAPSRLTRESVGELIRQLQLPDLSAEELAPLLRVLSTAA
jgi:hypothetical protein